MFFPDILSADRQLACEIEFDLRKFEEREAAEREAALAREQQNTPIQQGGPMLPQGLGGRSPRSPVSYGQVIIRNRKSMNMDPYM